VVCSEASDNIGLNKISDEFVENCSDNESEEFIDDLTNLEGTG
jgi:hypothetical protein